jgi:hypothetical protein
MPDIDTLLQTYHDILDYCRKQHTGDTMVAWAELAAAKLKELEPDAKLSYTIQIGRASCRERV